MKVTVIGTGVMGPGIAQVFLMGGHEVCMTDLRAEALAAGLEEIKTCLALMDELGMSPDTPNCLAALTQTTDLANAVRDAELVVEAIPERFDLKKALYEQLDPLCEPDAVIVSNTSAFPLPKMLPDFRPGNFFVAHFYNPPAVIPLVELVRDENTDSEKVLWLRRILEDCGKKPIVLNGFVNGFLINRMQTALAREALYLLGQGLVSPEDLNTASIFGIGFKAAWQGFFETMDYIGLDTVAFVYQQLYPDLCNDTEVPAVVGELVAQGKLGVKTGEGFLRHEASPAEDARKRLKELLEQLRLYNQYENSAPRHPQP